ncbi:MAG: hypothetical protein NVS2B9_11130 [Myxococcales bacterium]
MPGTPRYAVAAAAACAAAFGAVLVVAYFVPFARAVDVSALAGFASLDRRWLRPVESYVAHSCDPLPFAIIGMVLLGLAWRLGGLRRALAVSLLLVGANVSSQLLKPFLAHFRDVSPGQGVHQIPTAAYPSGHATAAMSLALALVLAAPRAYRPLAALGGGAFALAVSFCVLVLEWHFPSDILGGFLLASTWALLAMAALRAAAIRWPETGDIRRAAREAISAPRTTSLAGAVAAAGALVLGVALTRVDRLAAYAQGHHAFIAVATSIAIGAAVLIAGVTALSGRRR